MTHQWTRVRNATNARGYAVMTSRGINSLGDAKSASRGSQFIIITRSFRFHVASLDPSSPRKTSLFSSLIFSYMSFDIWRTEDDRTELWSRLSQWKTMACALFCAAASRQRSFHSLILKQCRYCSSKPRRMNTGNWVWTTAEDKRAKMR